DGHWEVSYFRVTDQAFWNWLGEVFLKYVTLARGDGDLLAKVLGKLVAAGESELAAGGRKIRTRVQAPFWLVGAAPPGGAQGWGGGRPGAVRGALSKAGGRKTFRVSRATLDRRRAMGLSKAVKPVRRRRGKVLPEEGELRRLLPEPLGVRATPGGPAAWGG